jgi:hypothetical protein
MKDEGNSFCMKAQELVVKVVQAFQSNNFGSQDTLKLNCSNDGSEKTAIDSRTTEKLPSSDQELASDGNFFVISN